MPWVLIAAAVLLAIVTFVIRDHARRDSVVVVQSHTASTDTSTKTAGGVPSTKSETNATSNQNGSAATGGSTSQRGATSSSGPKTLSAFQLADDLPAEKKTTTEKALPDSVFSTLLGIAAVLFVLGAFYARISKISVGGNTVELTGDPGPTAERDAEAIAEEISERITQKLKAAAGSEGAVPADQAAKIAELSAAAAAHAQAEAARLRLTAAAVTPAVQERSAISVNADELQALGTGMPLPPALLKRLADQALEELGDVNE